MAHDSQHVIETAAGAAARDTAVPNRFGLELLLRPFARVAREEVSTVLLLTFNVFLLLTAYYVLKVVREPLIMTGGGAEVKSYSSAGQVLLLAPVIRVYTAMCNRYGRMRLLTVITLFFVANIGIFFALSRFDLPLGVPFYLWVGVFNVVVIAQFWAFANDIYNREQGERLFPILGVGSALGAVFGAQLASMLLVPVGIFAMLPLAAGLLLLYLLLTAVAHRRSARRPAAPRRDRRDAPPPQDEPIGRKQTLTLLRSDSYLLLVAALTLLINWVNTTGEYILDRELLINARAAVADGAASGLTVAQYIGTFRADFFGWVNLLGLLLQMFLVSRLLRWIGVGGTLFVLPLVSLVGYGAMAIAPILSLIAVAKIAENSIDYSLEKTAREALFLVTTREAKYKAKTAIDTLFWRGGDLLAAGVVWLGNSLLTFRTVHFVWVNLFLTAAWIGVMFGIWRLHHRRAAEVAAPAEC